MRHRRISWLALAIVGLAAASVTSWFLWTRATDAELLNNAIRLVDRGRTEKAIPLFDEVLRRDPANGTALLYRGQISRDSGDAAAAERFWNRVPDQPPREGGTARFLEGTLFLEAKRTRPAEAALLKAVALHPTFLPPHERLLKLYVAQLRTADIRRELNAIRQFRPWTLEELYEQLNITGEAANKVQTIPHFQEFVAADPDDVRSLVALGRYYNWDERHREAAEVLQRALVLQPDDSAIRAYLAEAWLGQLNPGEAQRILQGVTLKSDALPCVWRSHGLYWFLAGDWPHALACLARAVELDPNDRSTVYKLGLAHERTGDKLAAQRAFRRADLLVRLQIVMFRALQTDRHSPQLPIADLREAAGLLTELNRHQEAAAFFEQLLAWNPESQEARNNLAQAQERARSAAGDDRELADRELADPELAGAATAEIIEGIPPVPPLPKNAAPPESSRGRPPVNFIRLVDRHREAGINYQYFNGETGLKYLLETTGGGVGALDFDADGWPDLYFPQGCRIPFDDADSTFTDRLYRNLGNESFADVTAATGLHDNQYGQGCAAGDYDNDGFPDLAVANYGTNVIYRNNGDGTFNDVSQACGIAGRHYSTSLGWGDLDGDGNLDLIVVNYVPDPLRVCHRKNGAATLCHPLEYPAESDILYVNLGDGTFADATKDAGLVADDGRGLGV